jgi:sugar phosphate permease
VDDAGAAAERAAPPSVAPRGRWASLAGATAAQVGISFVEQGAAALVPYVKAEYGLSSAAAGVFGTSLNIGRTLSGTISIAPVARYGERRMIVAGGVLSGVLALAAAAAPSAPATLVLLVASGVTQTVAILAGVVAVAAWFRSGSRGIAMGIRQAAVPVGGALAAGTLPFLALELGWREALAVAGGISIVTGVAGAALYRDHGTGLRERLPRGSTRAGIAELVRDRRLARAVLAGAVLAAVQFALLTYVQLYLVEDLGTSLELAAGFLTATLVAGVAGRLVWGVVSDVVFRGRRREVLLAILVLAAGACIALAAAGAGTVVTVALPAAVVLGFTTVGSAGVYLALIADLSPARSSVGTMGVAITCIQGTSLVVPPVFGALADASGSHRAGWLALAGLLALTLPALRTLRGS